MRTLASICIRMENTKVCQPGNMWNQRSQTSTAIYKCIERWERSENVLAFFFLLKIKTVVVISFKWNNLHKLVQISVRETNQRDHSITSAVLWSTSYSVPVLMAAVELRANTFVKAWFPKKQPQCALWFRVFVKQIFHLSWRNFLFAPTTIQMLRRLAFGCPFYYNSFISV